VNALYSIELKEMSFLHCVVCCYCIQMWVTVNTIYLTRNYNVNDTVTSFLQALTTWIWPKQIEVFIFISHIYQIRRSLVSKQSFFTQKANEYVKNTQRIRKNYLTRQHRKWIHRYRLERIKCTIIIL
jgi:hypothetical protein